MQKGCNRAEQEKSATHTLMPLNFGCRIQYTLFTGTANQSCNQENKGISLQGRTMKIIVSSPHKNITNIWRE